MKRQSSESTHSNFSIKSSLKECNLDLEKNIKCAWTKEEENLLLHLKNTMKLQTWVEVASQLPGKNPKQCSYRYKKLSSTLEKTSWIREDDLKLLELVDYFGERFDIIKTYFDSKTENDIRARYFKKINPKYVGFTPEEDSIILNLYYNKIICDATHNLILLKGLLSIRRRLETLLKMRGEEMNKNFDIISILSNCTTLQSNIDIKNQVIIKSEIYAQIEESNLNDESFYSKSDMASVYPKGCNDDNEDLIQSFANRFEDFEMNDLFCGNYEMGVDLEMSSECLSIATQSQSHRNSEVKLEPISERYSAMDIDKEKEENLGNFENVFMNTFNSNLPHDTACKSDNFISDCEDDISNLVRSSNIENLKEKQKQLEGVLMKLNQLSEMFYHSINDKLVYSVMKDKDKKTLMDLYNNTIIQEKNLIVE